MTQQPIALTTRFMNRVIQLVEEWQDRDTEAVQVSLYLPASEDQNEEWIEMLFSNDNYKEERR